LKSHMNWEEMEARRVWEYGIWELRNRSQKWLFFLWVSFEVPLCFYFGSSVLQSILLLPIQKLPSHLPCEPKPMWFHFILDASFEISYLYVHVDQSFYIDSVSIRTMCFLGNVSS
jgi:hypothetical protein